jgi:hypothetical protein
MTNSVNIVEANEPKMSDQAKPEKIGSMAMGAAESMAVAEVNRMGRSSTTRLSMMASKSDLPLA